MVPHLYGVSTMLSKVRDYCISTHPRTAFVSKERPNQPIGNIILFMLLPLDLCQAITVVDMNLSARLLMCLVACPTANLPMYVTAKLLLPISRTISNLVSFFCLVRCRFAYIAVFNSGLLCSISRWSFAELNGGAVPALPFQTTYYYSYKYC